MTSAAQWTCRDCAAHFIPVEGKVLHGCPACNSPCITSPDGKRYEIGAR